MRLLVFAIIAAILSSPALFGVQQGGAVRSAGVLHLSANSSTPSEIESMLRPHIGPVRVEVREPLTAELRGFDGMDLAWAASRAYGAHLLRNGTGVVITRVEPRVNIDAVDIDGRIMLQELARQCGVRNLVFDPDLPAVSASFVFRDVGCAEALPIVLRTLGWAAEGAGNTLSVDVLR